MIRGSLRTRYDHIDVNEIAKKLGGGGHKKAAGFQISGTILDGKIYIGEMVYTPQQFAQHIQDIG
jgi:nanoRNase/pAp phosphatase (c-di-AMP/oligoRNAs hydrolase)